MTALLKKLETFARIEFVLLCFAVWTFCYQVSVALSVPLIASCISCIVLLFSALALDSKKNLRIYFDTDSSTRHPGHFTNIVACLCAVAALTIHRPDLDDCFHLSAALSAKLHIFEPAGVLPQLMFEAPDWYWLPANWRFQALEPLVGVLAALVGLEPIYLFHLLVSALGAALVVIAFSKLYKILAPQFSDWLLLATVVVFFSCGASNVSFGNFGGFVRLHQGKGIFLTALLPLLAAYTLRFSITPNYRNFCWLFIAQVASIGLSSTALFLAPLTVGITALSQIQINKQSFRTLIICSLSTLYVGIAILLISTTSADPVGHISSLDRWDNLVELPLYSFQRVVGIEWLNYLSFASCLLAWLTTRELLTRRFLLFTSVLNWLLFLNPVSVKLVAGTLIPVRVYYRIIFLLHIPVQLAFVLCAPPTLWAKNEKLFSASFLIGYIILVYLAVSDRLHRHAIALNIHHELLWFSVLLLVGVTTLAFANTLRRKEIAATVAYTLLITLMFSSFHTAIPEKVVVHPRNTTNGATLEVKFPTLKVHEENFEIAKYISEIAQENSAILAPEVISAWIPTISPKALPLLARYEHFIIAKPFLDEQELSTRLELKKLTIGKSNTPTPSKTLRAGLRKYPISIVCFEKAALTKSLRNALRKSGFTIVRTTYSYVIWSRSS